MKYRFAEMIWYEIKEAARLRPGGSPASGDL